MAALSVLHKVLPFLPDVISSWIYGLLFAVKLALGVSTSGKIYESEKELPDADTTTAIYATHNKRPKNARTIVVIHGLSMTGNKDPRMVNLAKSFAAANPSFVVVAPQVREVAEIDLRVVAIERIQCCLKAIASDPDLCPSGRISIASPCISAGFTIIAVSELENIDALFLVGSHADVKSVTENAIERKGKGDCRYGIYAVLSSFYSSPDDPLRKLLGAYCHDDHMSNLGFEANKLPPLLEEYPEAAKQYRRILDDGEYACELLQEVCTKNKEEIDKMSAIPYLDKVKARYVTLVHSETDEIVPPRDSITLRDAWACREDMTVSCAITALINHGDQQALGLKDIPEIFRLVYCFSMFFRRVDPPSLSEKKTS